jgi:hypothetical protein
MDVASLLIPILAVSAYLATVACRIAVRRGRRPAWYLVLASSVLAAAVIVVVGYLGVLSVPGDVPIIGGVRYWSRVAPLFFAFSTALALVPGFMVLLFYRRRRGHVEKTG